MGAWDHAAQDGRRVYADRISCSKSFLREATSSFCGQSQWHNFSDSERKQTCRSHYLPVSGCVIDGCGLGLADPRCPPVESANHNAQIKHNTNERRHIPPGYVWRWLLRGVWSRPSKEQQWCRQCVLRQFWLFLGKPVLRAYYLDLLDRGLWIQLQLFYLVLTKSITFIIRIIQKREFHVFVVVVVVVVVI